MTCCLSSTEHPEGNLFFLWFIAGRKTVHDSPCLPHLASIVAVWCSFTNSFIMMAIASWEGRNCRQNRKSYLTKLLPNFIVPQSVGHSKIYNQNERILKAAPEGNVSFTATVKAPVITATRNEGGKCLLLLLPAASCSHRTFAVCCRYPGCRKEVVKDSHLIARIILQFSGATV